MSDFAPPSGPPPPRVPEGWKAVWNQQYQEWFYVNTYTKESTWEKPNAPASGRDDSDLPPGAPPPSYNAGPNAPNISDTKKTPLESNNPYSQVTGARETDEEMARRLQREEDERQRGGTSPLPGADRGASDSYYQNSANSQQYPTSPGLQGGYPGGPSSSSYPQQTTTDTKRGSGGFFGKLKDKLGGSQGSSGYPARPSGYGQPGYGQQYPQQGMYGQQYPQQPMYAQQGMYGAQPARRHGMGAGGAAALGVGGGLLGGMLIGEAMDGGDGGGDGGGDYGGGDMGGGDMGGGGDF